MSFILRQVTQRAGGGDIVRTRTLGDGEILIGRGADCAVQLPDLAVSLNHARLWLTSPGELEIEGEAGQTFETDGRFVSRARVKVADRPHLMFGDHVVTLSPGEAAGDILITVERSPAAGHAADDEALRSFSPAAVGPSRRASAWILSGLILALCLIVPAAGFFVHQNARIHADRQWATQPLSKSHAFLERNCQACHQAAFVAVRDEACKTCHDAAHRGTALAANRAAGAPDKPDLRLVAAHADAGRLMRATPLPADLGGRIQALFRRAFNHPDDRCASCHREHLDAPTRDKPALVMTQDCAACHGALKSRLTDTSLIDTPDWGRHPEFRPLVTTGFSSGRPVAERIPLDRRPLQHQGLIFQHDVHLLATGTVARMAQVLGRGRGYGGALSCAACHRPDASGEGFRPIEMTRDCAACHSLAFANAGGSVQYLRHGHPDQVVAQLTAVYGASGGDPAAALPRRPPGQGPGPAAAGGPITPSAAASAAVRRAFSPGGACYDCHRVLAPPQAGSLAYAIAPVRLTGRYLTRGDFNHAIAAHRKDSAGRETCGDCHAVRASHSAEDLLLPPISRCAACHGKTRTQTPQAAGADCAECHAYHAPGAPTPSRG